MKKVFVTLTLSLCMLLLTAAPSEVFAASSCAKAKAETCGKNTAQNIVKLYSTDQAKKYSKYMRFCINNNCDSIQNSTGSNCGNLLFYIGCGKDQNSSTGNNCGKDQNATCSGWNCGNDQNTENGSNSSNNNSNNGSSNSTNGSSSSNSGSYTKQVAELVNKQREAAGLASLSYSSELSKVAQAKAEDMAANNYFSHTSPTYGSPFDMMKQFGITYTAAGENIAKGQKTPESVMNAWMNSQGHKENILNSNYEKIGVGYTTDSNGNTYWVQMFIR